MVVPSLFLQKGWVIPLKSLTSYKYVSKGWVVPRIGKLPFSSQHVTLAAHFGPPFPPSVQLPQETPPCSSSEKCDLVRLYIFCSAARFFGHFPLLSIHVSKTNLYDYFSFLFQGQSKLKNRTQTKISLKCQNLSWAKIGIEPKFHESRHLVVEKKKHMAAFKWSIYVNVLRL